MSGISENIPNGWIQTTIGELVELAQGVAINAKTKHVLSNEDEGIPLLKINNLINDTIDQYANPTLVPKKSIIHKNDVIFTRTGQVGEVFKNKFGILHNNSFKVIPNEELHWSYLYWYLKDRRVYNYVQKVAAGSVQKDLNHGAFKTIEFKYPKDIEEQKAIANILTAFDDKIENLQAQNKTLEQTAQTIFKEWFGKYQVGDEQPDGWRVGKITELFEIRDGTHDSPKQKEIGYKLITSKHLGNNRIKLEDAYLISEEDYINVNKRSRVEQFDILVSMIGTIGLIYLEQNELINYAIKNVALFKTSQNKSFSIYTYLWLKSSFGKYFFETSKSGTTQEYISLKSFRAIELVIPDDKMINRFNNIVVDLFGKIKNNTAQTQTLKQTRDTLLPKLMSGQLRVNEFKS